MKREELMTIIGTTIRFEMNRIVEETCFYDMEEMTERITEALEAIKKASGNGFKNSISEAAKRSKNETVQRWYNCLTEMYKSAKKNGCDTIAELIKELATLNLSYEQKCKMMNVLERAKQKEEKKKNPYKPGTEYWKVFEEYAKFGEYLTYQEVKEATKWTHWISSITSEMEREKEREKWLVEPYEKKNEVEYAGIIDEEADILNELQKMVDSLKK